MVIRYGLEVARDTLSLFLLHVSGPCRLVSISLNELDPWDTSQENLILGAYPLISLMAVMEIKVFILLCFDISMFKYNFIRNSCLLFRVRLVMILIELELLIGPIQEFNKYTRRKFSVESSFILYS